MVLQPLQLAVLLGCLAGIEAGSCGDFTLDTCSVEVDGVLETVKDVNEESCQNYCGIIYENQCSFFIHDRKQQICHLMRQSRKSYERTCRKTGGPKQPEQAQCNGNDTSSCHQFLEGYCKYQGSLLEHLEAIESVDKCQYSCIFLDQCRYFLYDEDLMDCQLYDSEERDCDLLRGDISPDYAECKRSRSAKQKTNKRKKGKKQSQESSGSLEAEEEESSVEGSGESKANGHPKKAKRRHKKTDETTTKSKRSKAKHGGKSGAAENEATTTVGIGMTRDGRAATLVSAATT